MTSLADRKSGLAGILPSTDFFCAYGRGSWAWKKLNNVRELQIVIL